MRMKKFILTLICSIFTALGATAQIDFTYTDQLLVSVDGEQMTPVEATVEFRLDTDNLLCDFTLPNFVLMGEGIAFPVGTIHIEGIAFHPPIDGVSTFDYQGNITIPDGDDPSIEYWYGSMLGELPLTLSGKINDDRLYVLIDLDLTNTDLQQVVHVQFGEDKFNGNETPDPDGPDGPDNPDGPSDELGSKQYTDNLVVTVNGESTAPQPTTVSFTDNGDGTCNFTLPNFCLGEGDGALPVGNIDIQNIPLSAGKGGVHTFAYSGIITISAGDDPTKEFWMGPELGALPLVLSGKVTKSKIYVAITLDLMEMIEQIVEVEFGDSEFPETDGILAPMVGQSTSFYDLHGRRLSATRCPATHSSSIVINGGRKIIVK